MELAAPNTEKVQRDIVLVKRALEGDQKAYAELMSYYREPLYYMLLKMCNNPYDAEDLTIEAFGKAFRNIEKYSESFAFSTWLFKIAANNCVDFLRKKTKAPQCIDDDLQDFTANGGNATDKEQKNPEQSVIEKQRVKMLHWAVAQLRPNYRTLVELRYFEEYSYEEIAQEMNMSLSNVKIQLFRAKDMLAAIMKNVKNTI
ncbi:MAG: sigma-70 family RNA polymerase sigma factor [Bacteroidales bacterium]|nr:sigma-70 family RNA polymerase sigma factor [Bacteroidales bacterium]